ncbi:MAG: aldehyde dehydrogenase family protein, partial [Sphingopyxis sp.]
AVFGASNFPLAFSVAGGDTASALAAGCPVVVKGHPAHPATGEYVARAILAAVRACGLPDGVFSYLPGADHALGAALVADARIQAVGFTGSRSGGLALVAAAQQRPVPVPVYAEMSSVNPIILLPGALAGGADALGAAFAASLTMGAGQFCTNPGLVLGVDGPDLDRFIAAAGAALAVVEPPVMLNPGIHAHYNAGVAALAATAGADQVARGMGSDAPNRCTPALFAVASDAVRANPRLTDEVFGAAAVVVRCRDLADVAAVITGLEGQLTATLHMDRGDADGAAAAALAPLLRNRAGRVLANGWPTGVEVCDAMVHGGPYPATSDARTTSVGTLAMMRFVRPICYQDMPETLLPPPLQTPNPWAVPRRVNGTWGDAA